jgi:hypothetical protein
MYLVDDLWDQREPRNVQDLAGDDADGPSRAAGGDCLGGALPGL